MVEEVCCERNFRNDGNLGKGDHRRYQEGHAGSACSCCSHIDWHNTLSEGAEALVDCTCRRAVRDVWVVE